MDDKQSSNDIIKKQRQIAAQLAKVSQGQPKEKNARPAPPPPRQIRPSSFKKGKTARPAPPPPPRQIRPSSFKKKATSSVLAAARSKASGNPVGKKGATVKVRRNVKASIAAAAKRTDPTSGSSRLASLVQSAAKESPDDGTAFDTPYSPDDFWKNIREWSFVSDIHRQIQGEDQDKQKAPTKPIPDTFISTRHYIMAWGPKCLAEARAQLVSEVLTEYGQRDSGKSPFVLVDVETTWKTGRKARALHTDLMDTDSCHVQLKVIERCKMQFHCHDICGLIPVDKKDMVERLLRGRQSDLAAVGGFEDSLSQFCMIGHSETQRRELNGLILKVSKRKWAIVGSEQMYFFKIGSNITALREFTALCKVDSIPLKKFLLGTHLKSAKQGSGSSERKKHSVHETLVEEMGGVSALGKGFTEYVQRKFNPSQLRAISAASSGYGDGGITLIKGPPGTGKTTMLVACLNSLHIRQYNKYYEEVRRIAAMQSGNRQGALDIARKAKPRLLVCAPSNAGVDNVILRIMEDGFVDGSGQRYNPSMIRVGVGQSSVVRDVALSTKVDQILSETDVGQLDKSIAGFRMELQRITSDIAKCRRKAHAIVNASPWPLARDWEIRCLPDDDVGNTPGNAPRVYFVNHKEQRTTYDCPPPPEPGEKQFHATSMPEYRTYMSRIVKLVENYFSVKSNLELNTIVKGTMDGGANQFAVRQALETHVLNSVHIVMTTLGSAGNRVLEGADKFEVVVVDEAAQSVEPSTLSALQLGSHHCVLVGDTNQLPATIFNLSGRNSKYDRSLFQRLEESGEEIHMLNEQYRMHPMISHFPRTIFYGGLLKDGPNVKKEEYGNPLIKIVRSQVPQIKPFSVLDLDSKEERGGTSLANSTEAHLVVHLYTSLRDMTNANKGIMGRVAVVTPYSQQASLLRGLFRDLLGSQYTNLVEIGTVDAFQGREANIVIFSAVRAAGSHGIGFLSDVRRMNVALTRAKHFLFVIARCDSIVVNPYWKDLIEHAKGQNAVLKVPCFGNDLQGTSGQKPWFGNAKDWKQDGLKTPSASSEVSGSIESVKKPTKKPTDPRKMKASGNGKIVEKPSDPRKKGVSENSKLPTKPLDPRKTKEAKKPPDPRRKNKTKKPSDPRKLKTTNQPSDPRKRKRS